MNIKYKKYIVVLVFKILLFNLLLKKRIIRFFGRNIIFIMGVITIFVDFLALYSAVRYYCSKIPNKCSWVIFFTVNFIAISISAYLTSKEHKRENAYMSNLWVSTWLFIEAVFILTILQYPNISSFLSNKNRNNGFIFIIGVFLIMIIAWVIYLRNAIKSKRKTKNIDVTELTIIFSKSVLQSIVSFIALFGLLITSLNNGLIYFALIIDIYAAYICPILDINKYIREKEIEQLKDKDKTTI